MKNNTKQRAESVKRMLEDTLDKKLYIQLRVVPDIIPADHPTNAPAPYMVTLEHYADSKPPIRQTEIDGVRINYVRCER